MHDWLLGDFEKQLNCNMVLTGGIVPVSRAYEKCMYLLSLLAHDVQEWTVLYFQRKLIKCEWRSSREPHWVVFLLCVCFVFC